MKALPMLDHVMLWVARGFAIFYLGLSTLAMYTIFGELRQAFTWGHFLTYPETPEILFAVIVPVLWNLALWRLNKDVGRLYLVLSGGFLFSYFAYHLARFFIMQPGLPDGKDCFGALILIGYLALAWTGFRAPAIPPLKLTLPLTSKTRTDSGSSTPTSFFQKSLPSANLVIP